MKVNYDNQRIAKIFTDFNKMKRKIPSDWVRLLKKHLDRLDASDNFGVFLSIGVGKPEELSGYHAITYSIRITANVRLIIELRGNNDAKLCDEYVVKGVCDYHGDKNNWYIS